MNLELRSWVQSGTPSALVNVWFVDRLTSRRTAEWGRQLPKH